MIKIACVGDNVVDINYVDGMIHPGGNCVNVAVYCSQMGHEAAYVGVIADDSNAKILTDSLEAYKVDYSFSPIMKGETGRCTCRLVNGERILEDENDGGLVKSSPLQIDNKIVNYLKSFDIIHTSCYSYIDNQLDKLKSTAVDLLYDFSTEWTPDKVRFAAKYVDYFLFSEREDLSDKENNSILNEAVDKYGAKIAILTKGIKGAWVYDGDKVYFKEPYNVQGGAIDTTGCGDSWVSGFIVTYIEQMKKLTNMKEMSDERFISKNDESDVKQAIINLAMCEGNLKARQTCRIKGAYNWGIPIGTK